MFPARHRLTPSQRADLAIACEIGAEKLALIADRVTSGQLTIRRSKIEAVICEEVGEDRGAALGRLVFGIAGTFRRSMSTPAEFLGRLDVSMAPGSSDADRLAAWPDCRPALQRLLETQSVILAAKALDVSYDFERVYLAGRLLTSVRPIFDEPREEIVGSTVVQTLRVEFFAPNGDQSSISIALDAEDINKLKEECERAISKAEKAKEKIEKDCGIEAIIPGEEQ